MPVDFYSLVPLYIEMFIEDGVKPIGNATGFSVRVGEQHYLITNWHVVTGRHTDTNEPLDGPCDPDIVRVWFHSAIVGRWIPKTFRLRDDGINLWIEHPTGKNVDVVAIPYTPEAGVRIKNLDLDSMNVTIKVYPSKAVSILGFPNGLAAGGKFPIWKKGHIASELSVDFDNKPLFLIDATTRKGMSGSPVILRESGLVEFESNPGDPVNMRSGTHTRFLGIYSGRIDGDAEIGRVWKPNVINEIIQKKKDNLNCLRPTATNRGSCSIPRSCFERTIYYI